jgi:cell division transport system permease protein
LRYFGRETLNNLWQYRIRNLFSITIICLSFLILGVFLSLSNNLKYLAGQVAENVAVVFFLEQDITESQRRAVQQKLTQSTYVRQVNYINARDALVKFRDRFPELKDIVDNLKSNPFPSSVEVTLKENFLASQATADFITQMAGEPGVEDVQFNQDWIERMRSLSRLASAIGFFLGGILILASFFIISNVIKLNVFSRQDEIEILRMSGATNMFIRIPFLLEGVILGFLGGLISLLLLLILIRVFPIYLGRSLGALNELINFRFLTFSQSLNVVMGGAVIGFTGSLTSLARFLKN